MKRWRLKNLSVDRVDLVDNPANPLADMALIYKREELTATEGTVSDTQDLEDAVSDQTDTPEDVVKQESLEDQLTTALAERDEARASLEAMTAPTEPVVEAEPVAMSDEPVEDIEKADLRKSLEAAQAEIAKMKHEARAAEFIAKAKTDLDNLGDASELGGLLLAAADSLPAEAYQLLERTLKAANAQVGSGDLFAQIGKADAEPAEVLDRIAKMAQEMVDKGEARTLELAKLAVAQKHPELVREYESARNA
jgi:hypothetical protein